MSNGGGCGRRTFLVLLFVKRARGGAFLSFTHGLLMAYLWQNIACIFMLVDYNMRITAFWG